MPPNKVKEVMIAYIVGQGTDALNSITVAKAFSDEIQNFYEDNFGYPIVLSADEPIAELNSFKIEQNYPNPFNPSTKIKFAVPSNVKRIMSNVSLKLYNILGNEIATLVNEELSPGEYEVTFNSHSGEVRNLTSGIYFYTLRAGEFIQTKKIILLK